MDKRSTKLPRVPDGAYDVVMIVERFDPVPLTGMKWFEWKRVKLRKA